MKTLWYILILACFGLIIIDKTTNKEAAQPEMMQLQHLKIEQNEEAAESKKKLDSVIVQIEKNHLYLRYQLKDTMYR